MALLPGGRGTHCELGMALAYAECTGAEVFVHAPDGSGFFEFDDRTCAFYHHPLVRRVVGGTMAELAAVVDSKVLRG